MKKVRTSLKVLIFLSLVWLRVMQVELKGRILQGRSVRKILVREAKSTDSDTLVVGATRQSALG